MCGRYVSVAEKADLVELYQATAPDPLPAPSYNVAPTQQVTAVIETRDPDGERHRNLKAVKWGLIPSWATDAKIGSRLINARQEGLESKPAWRGSFRKKRAILPMAGFYEWMPVERADGTVRKQPYYIHPIENDRVLSVAGLYELWRDPEAAEGDPNRWLWTATVITCDAKGPAGEIHDRTPMMLPGDRVDAWLDPGLTDKNQVRQLLTGIEVPPLEARAVSPAVNRVGTNRPELLEPIDTGADQQLQLALAV